MFDNLFLQIIIYIFAFIIMYLWFLWRRKISLIEKDRIILEAEKQANEILQTEKREIEQFKIKAIEDVRQKEDAISYREGAISLQIQGILEQENNLKIQHQTIEAQKKELEAAKKQLEKDILYWQQQISRIAGISRDEATQSLMLEVKKEAFKEAANISRKILENAKSSAEEEAKKIIVTAIQRCTLSHPQDFDSTTIDLPNQDLRGRIIGKDGRNIKTFANKIGVTVIVDNSCSCIVLSSFDPVRREIARRAMNVLIQDGRFNPSRIEEIIDQATIEVEKATIEAAQNAIIQSGIPLLPNPVLSVLGKLKFRYSYSQNVLAHSVEVANLAGLIAAELGINSAKARRAGLLHDIGKAIDHEHDGSHDKIGAEFLERNMETPEIVECVAKHHEQITLSCNNPLIGIVAAADALSATRPGARIESISTYLKRIKELETMANEIPNVEKCFVLQAGRELRVFVEANKTNDDQCEILAHYLSHKIENNLQYRGNMKITVIREKRYEASVN